MAIPDTDLGISVDFPTQDFRNAITFAMQMGEHPDPTRRLIFVKKVAGVTYWRNGSQLGSTPELDRDGNPLDPTVEIRRQDDQEISVDYAVEVTESSTFVDSGVGVLRPTRITITLADGEYAKVKDCREALYNGDRFIYVSEPEAVGLFDVAFHTLIYVAKDDT
jgi:hypothetical protein